MKMINAGQADIMNFAPYSRNCNVGICGRKYLAPVPSLNDVQVFVNFGLSKPIGFEFSIIDLCTPNKSAVAISDCYVIAWNGSYWYGIFKNFSSSAGYDTFILALITGSATFFSEQYAIESSCERLTKLSVVYPSNYNSEDINGIYVGTGQQAEGKAGMFYRHNFWTRQGEVVETGNKITFISNKYKNFASTLNKTFEFRPELVPGWYKDYLLSVYFRGDILINDVHAIVTELNFEDVDVDYWKAYAVLGKEVNGGFGCTSYALADSDCAPPTPPICVGVNLGGPVTFADAVQGHPYNKSIQLYGTQPFTDVINDLPSWMAANISGNQLVITGTPGIDDIGAGVIDITVSNECGEVTVAGNLMIVDEPPEVAISGLISVLSLSGISVQISDAIPCDLMFFISGMYDNNGTAVSWFTDLSLPAGETLAQKLSVTTPYPITCVTPQENGGTTFESVKYCNGVNYVITLLIETPCLSNQN